MAAGREKKLGRPVGTASAPDRRKSRPTGTRPIERLPFPEFCRRYLVHSVDRFAGLMFELEDWQDEFMAEALLGAGPKFDWESVVLVLPRKNGKTTLLAAYALWRLFEDGQPEILLAAASDKQAGRLFDTVVSFIRRNPDIADNLHLREYVGEISRVDGGGKILRMASDPATLHGYNPSLVICDELHAWHKPTQRKAWAALTTAGGARDRTQTFTITTAGEASERATSILGQLIDRNELEGEVERREGLTISRNQAAKTLVWNYSAPTLDAKAVPEIKKANPASWVTVEYLERQAANPELSTAEVLQLHGCVWAEGKLSWIPAETWERCYEANAAIPEGDPVFVGVDIGLVHDSTAVAKAWVRGDGRVVIEAKVWTPGSGVIELAEIEDYIRSLAANYHVVRLYYDPRFFERSAQILAEERLEVVSLYQNSAPMADAYQSWYAGCMEGLVAHGGDPTLTAHVMGTAAEKTERGWRVSKIRQSQRIDACVAAAMAHYGASAYSKSPKEPMVAWA